MVPAMNETFYRTRRSLIFTDDGGSVQQHMANFPLRFKLDDLRLDSTNRKIVR